MSGTRVRPMPQVPCILHTIHVYCILLCVYTSMLHTRQVQVSAYFKVSMRHPAQHSVHAAPVCATRYSQSRALRKQGIEAAAYFLNVFLAVAGSRRTFLTVAR